MHRGLLIEWVRGDIKFDKTKGKQRYRFFFSFRGNSYIRRQIAVSEIIVMTCSCENEQ